MLSKRVTLTVEESVLYWRNRTFIITREEAQAIADEVRRLVQAPEVTAMLVDNRGVGGAWPAEVNPIWADLMEFLKTTIDKCATIASLIVVMQINRISKAEGTLDKIQAFEKTEDALRFIGVPSLALLDEEK